MQKNKRNTTHEVLRTRKGGAHIEKGKRPKDKQNMKHKLSRGDYE